MTHHIQVIAVELLLYAVTFVVVVRVVVVVAVVMVMVQ